MCTSYQTLDTQAHMATFLICIDTKNATPSWSKPIMIPTNNPWDIYTRPDGSGVWITAGGNDDSTFVKVFDYNAKTNKLSDTHFDRLFNPPESDGPQFFSHMLSNSVLFTCVNTTKGKLTGPLMYYIDNNHPIEGWKKVTASVPVDGCNSGKPTSLREGQVPIGPTWLFN